MSPRASKSSKHIASTAPSDLQEGEVDTAAQNWGRQLKNQQIERFQKPSTKPRLKNSRVRSDGSFRDWNYRAQGIRGTLALGNFARTPNLRQR
jgi:hypothetical protein